MTDPQPAGEKIRVAVLGGGAAALSAAFELSSPDNPRRDEYEITVYQLGWRFGGKGASGRNMHPEYAYRIEEHGVHAFMGFYENAFRVMQEAYAEIGRAPDAPLATWDEAFKPHSFMAIFEHFEGDWFTWPIDTPTNSDVPGEGGLWPSLEAYVEMALRWPKLIIESLRGTAEQAEDDADEDEAPAKPRLLGFFADTLEEAREKAERTGWGRVDAVMEDVLELGGLVARDAGEVGETLEQGCHKLADELGSDLEHLLERAGEAPKALAFDLLDDALDVVRKLIWWLLRKKIQDDPVIRELWVAFNFVVGNIIGAIRSDLFTRGLDSINDQDYREWLAAYLIDDDGLTLSSPLAFILYDAGFAFVEGDPQRPSFEAGTLLRILIRLFLTYKGAVAYKMQAGMGDVIFAPLYQVLAERGVKIEFFHRVVELVPDAAHQRIASIELEQQVELRDAAAGYQPLVPIKGLPCWPASPLWEQIRDPEAYRGFDLESYEPSPRSRPKTLRAGEDFDQVILGVSIGGLPCVAPRLIEHSERWREMIDHVDSVRTQGLQLWLKPTLYELGWTAESPITATYDPQQISSVWADMSQTLVREGWPALGDRFPLSVHYFCSAMPDLPGDRDPATACRPRSGKDVVRENALRLAEADLGHLWPDAVETDGSLKWHLLVDNREPPGEGSKRLDSQYWVSVPNPSDRYVLSVTGSSRYRLRTDESGYDNLLLTGDWIQNTFNAGAVESAVMSGLSTASALSGYPAMSDIIGWGFGEPEPED